jgi:hypothetical protein
MAIAILIRQTFFNTFSASLFIALSTVAFYPPTRQPMTSTNVAGHLPGRTLALDDILEEQLHEGERGEL